MAKFDNKLRSEAEDLSVINLIWTSAERGDPNFLSPVSAILTTCFLSKIVNFLIALSSQVEMEFDFNF